MCIQRRRRHGVLLLIVLFLLVLILLLGVSFLRTAYIYATAAKAQSRAVVQHTPPHQLTNTVLYQLLRDVPSDSSLAGHSLLRDLYGTDSFSGEIHSATLKTTANEQLIDIVVATSHAGSSDSFGGSVLTFLSGEWRGVSTRVTRFSRLAAGQVAIQVTTPASFPLETFPQTGDQLMINGSAFNGIGSGYNPASGKLDQQWRGRTVALLPHHAQFPTDLDPDLGGADESWDAVDYQNMYLARLPAEVTEEDPIIPSFHRPSLLRYWKTKDSTAWTNPDFQRHITLRPLSAFHPGFTGSNPRYNPIDGPWDVDNDSDGIADSIWLDVGLPVMTTARGQSYKPLAAILCVDLDGRFNLNAHGNEAQAAPPTAHATVLPNPAIIPGPFDPQKLPKGQGYGPSDIDLGLLFPNRTAYRSFLNARYANRTSAETMPGFAGDDTLRLPFHESSALSFDSDVYGQRRTLLDLAGHPYVTRSVLDEGRELSDDPYELSLLTPSSADARFSAAEMECILRTADTGSFPSPDRIGELLSNSPLNSIELSRVVTTLSADIGTPNHIIAPELRDRLAHGSSIHDVMRTKLSLTQNGSADLASEIDRQIKMMLPPELAQGQPMDINRTLTSRAAKQVFARQLYCLISLLANERFQVPAESPSVAQRTTSQRFAQWAINVVDFRDRDAAMTPFEYDINPFNGWQVDGNLDTDEGAERAVTWGCEYPHLLLTETLAFHDLRLKDTDRENGLDAATRHEPANGKQADEDLDQHRLPSGSAFLELYCTGNPHKKSKLTSDLYRRDSDGIWKLDLGKVAAGSSPVWRVAISAPHRSQQQSVEVQLFSQPDSLTLQPDFDHIPIERVVHFGKQPLVESQQSAFSGTGGVFYNRRGSSTLLAPKHYAVVGPRLETHLGLEQNGALSGNTIQLNAGEDANGVRVNGANALPYPTNSEIKPPLGIVVSMDLDAAQCGWSEEQSRHTYPDGVGFNVSMPLPNSPRFYPAPNPQHEDSASTTNFEPPLDTPLDADEQRPLGVQDLVGEGSRNNYRTVFLQRLADPSVAFHQVTNPYITVDWSPIDLAVFNGDDRQPEEWDDGKGDDGDPAPQDEQAGSSWVSASDSSLDPLVFGSRQRGMMSENIWRAFSIPPQKVPSHARADSPPGEQDGDALATELNFDKPLSHSLGFLNTHLFKRAYAGMPNYAGDPDRPFPWLTWNDRPFHNRFELLQVSTVSPSRFLSEFSVAGNADLYAPSADGFWAPYGHLFNFYQSSNSSQAAADLSRLLDYVAAPSPFVGTSLAIDAAMRVSKFQDPGRVNINTIHDQRVWDAVCGEQIAWSKLLASRGPVDNDDLPTRYPNPFRSAASSALMPLDTLKKNSAQATLLRGEAADPSKPLFHDPSTDNFRDTTKNPYFRYQMLQRLGGRVTNHSNVFAVWITIAYFAVEPNEDGIDEMHPEGFALTEELGSTLGQVKRHRSFYIIDRSVPVAFSPGKNHNVDRAILIRRVLE